MFDKKHPDKEQHAAAAKAILDAALGELPGPTDYFDQDNNFIDGKSMEADMVRAFNAAKRAERSEDNKLAEQGFHGVSVHIGHVVASALFARIIGNTQDVDPECVTGQYLLAFANVCIAIHHRSGLDDFLEMVNGDVAADELEYSSGAYSLQNDVDTAKQEKAARPRRSVQTP